MAATKGILALNLGTQTISLAEFQRNSDGGLTLTRLKQIEYSVIPPRIPTRSAQTKLQVEQLVSELGFKGRSVNYAIASHVIFTRPVTLPAVGDASQVEQIVAFEAQQNVPYPIDEVVWDWQLLDAGDGGQVEVILAAIKSDLLDEINDPLQAGGLKPAIVDIAPMALYNALRYNYPEVEGCTILLDIGSRTTNLLFCEPGKIFPRRLNIGGSSITTAIAKDFGCNFSEAETRKVRDGFVSLGGTYAEPDDAEIARISKITRNQMTRLHQEIARSITFYRSEHGGIAAGARADRGRHRLAAVYPRVFSGKIPGHGSGLFQSAPQRRCLGFGKYGRSCPRHAHARRTRGARAARARQLSDGTQPAPRQRGEDREARRPAACTSSRPGSAPSPRSPHGGNITSAPRWLLTK